MSAAPRRDHHRRGRSARRTRRTRPRPSPPPTRFASSTPSAPPATSGSRSRRSCRRAGCRRWPTPPRCSPASRRLPGVRYSALVPNLAGLSRAVDAGVDEVAVFAAAAERFSRANLNQSVDESLARFTEVATEARRLGLPVRGYVSCAFGCPFEGAIAPEAVLRVTNALLDHGRLRSRDQRHDWRRAPGPGTGAARAAHQEGLAGGPRAPPARHPGHRARQRPGRARRRHRPPSTPPPAASAAAPTPRAPRGIWRPRTCSTCSTALASTPVCR